MFLRRRSGSDVTVRQAMNVAILEERGGAAKDEIHVPRYVAVLEVLATAVHQDGVLPTEEPAVAKHHAVAINANRQSLPDGTRGILKGDVFHREIVRIDHRRRRAERADWLAVHPQKSRVEVVRQHRLLRVFTNEMDVTFLVLDMN